MTATRCSTKIPSAGPPALRCRVVVEAQAERDALSPDVHLHDFDLHDVTRFDDLPGVLDKTAGHGADVDEPILMDADVDEGAEGGDVGDDPLEHHAWLEVADLLHALGERGCLERRSRVTA